MSHEKTTHDRLSDEVRRFLGWFRNDALPLWAARGYDDAGGGFYEALNFDATPLIGVPRRVRVQARQIHAFSQSAIRGWHPGAESIAAKGFENFIASACPDDAARGCVHLLGEDGAVIDDRRDLYDQAFLLLACASRWEAAKDDRALAIAERTLDFLDRELASPHGGWLESDRRELPRRQNPHMHLFEALMALHRATGEDDYLTRAGAVYDLFTAKFFDGKHDALAEFFDEDWRPRPSPIEPGHMFEWVWLLESYEQLSGADAYDFSRRLFAKASGAGCDPAFHGFAFDRCSTAGESGAGKRLWPQTEKLRALFVMTGAMTSEEGLIADFIDALFNTYLKTDVPGLWIDEFDGQGRPAAKDVPASILYHLLEAAAEADAYLSAGTGA
ncbi:MAG: AGE family epimerase/isomerase [Parvularculaceae bacterium]